MGGVDGIMVIIIGNELIDLNLNPEWGCLHFPWEKHEQG